MGNVLGRLATLLKHQWLRGSALPSSLRNGAMERLAARVFQSESRHSGQIRICLEVALPWRYAWHQKRARERALSLFGSLRVWDTEDNNGVLIYLLLADRSIEIVADRALARHVPQPVWEALIARMADMLRSQHFEEALNQAVDEISALLELHCPGLARAGNELPDRPVVASSAL